MSASPAVVDGSSKKIVPRAKSSPTKISNEEAVEKGLLEQKKQLEAAKKSLTEWKPSDQANFKKYFGNVSNIENARSDKLGQIERMIDLNSEMSVNPTNFFVPSPNPPIPIGKPSEGKMSNDVDLGAYVHRDDPIHKIYTGNAFFNYGVVGGVSRPTEDIARLITHEVSHFNDIADTHDVFSRASKEGFYNGGKSVYGDKESKSLSDAAPNLALNHADSFSYFVSGLSKAH